MEKLTQTIETLGLPFVGYKMQSENIDQYLLNRAVAEQYGILPPFFFQSSSDGETFKERVAIEFLNVINDALKEKNVGWKISKLDVCHSGKILSAGRYIFHGTSDYGEVRKVMNSLDWDAIALSVQKEVDGDNDTYEYVELKDEVNGHPLDERWLELWENDAEFDQVFWSAYEKTDIMQWRGYAVQQGMTNDTKYPRALDFICWAMMTQDYDEFMTLIKDDKQVNAKTGIDLFASIDTNSTTSTIKTPIKESGNTTTMAQTTTPQTALTAQTPVTEAEQKKFFAGALVIPQIAASAKEWSRTGGTFETIVLHAIDADAFFTCDTKIVKTTGKPSNKKYQWIVVDGEKFSWNNIGDATKGFALYARACCMDDYAGMAKYMTEPSAKKWMAMLNGDDEAKQPKVEEPKAETPKVEQPKAEAPKTAPQFKGVTYNEPTGDGIYHLVWVSSDKCHIYGINGKGIVEVDMVLDKADTERCIAKASLQQIATPEKFYDALRKLNLEVASAPAPKAKDEPKTETAKVDTKKVVKTLDTKPQPKKVQPKVDEPKAEAPKVEQTIAPKADRLTIDKRDGGLFITGADADTADWIMAYVDSINAMKMRKIG